MSGRQRWADVAKGACIVLVVLWHVTRKDYLQLGWDLPLPVAGAWGAVSEVLLPVRMPLFFLVSGLFAARWLDRPWASVWSARVAPLLYLFVLWTSVHTLVLRLAPGFDTAVADGPHDLLVQLTVTPGNLWYLLALASYVVVARGARRWPAPLLGAALAVSAAAAAGLVATPGNRYGLLTNLVWFVLGTRLAVHGAVLARLTRPRPATTALAVLAFAGAAAAWQALDADAWLGVRPVLGLLGVLAGTTVAAQVGRSARLGPALASLGRRTLPVYVLHLPLVALLHLGSARVVQGRAEESLLLAVGYPVVVTAAVVAACLALHRVLVTVGAGWLFEAPWLRSGRAVGVDHDLHAVAEPPCRSRPLSSGRQLRRASRSRTHTDVQSDEFPKTARRRPDRLRVQAVVNVVRLAATALVSGGPCCTAPRPGSSGSSSV